MEGSNSPPPPKPPLFAINERVAFLSRVHFGTTVPLLALCLVPFFARMYIRTWPVWRFGLDDGFIVAGLLCAIADWALLSREMFLQPQEISWEETFFAIALAHHAIAVWGIAMTLIKTSIVLTLRRLPMKRSWKAVLYILLAVQFTFGLANTFYNFFKCRPFHASWDLSVTDKQCPGEDINVVVSNVGSATNIATDLVLSIAPMSIFWGLHRPLRERILICSLTGIGLFATFASVMKVVIMAGWANAQDRWATAISIATWTTTEQFVSVLAACSPSLKKPVEILLNKFGIPLVEPDPNISFLHVPEGMRGREVRRQAREWMGDIDTQVNPVVSDSTNGTFKKRDIESLVVTTTSTLTSTSTSDTAVQAT